MDGYQVKGVTELSFVFEEGKKQQATEDPPPFLIVELVG